MGNEYLVDFNIDNTQEYRSVLFQKKNVCSIRSFHFSTRPLWVVLKLIEFRSSHEKNSSILTLKTWFRNFPDVRKSSYCVHEFACSKFICNSIYFKPRLYSSCQRSNSVSFSISAFQKFIENVTHIFCSFEHLKMHKLLCLFVEMSACIMHMLFAILYCTLVVFKTIWRMSFWWLRRMKNNVSIGDSTNRKCECSIQ